MFDVLLLKLCLMYCCCFPQIFATAVLMILIQALNDPDNLAPSKGYVPLLVGLVVVAIGMTFSFNCGYALNPARDFAPRVFTYAAGWGIEVFR